MLGFDHGQMVGTMTLDETKLPPGAGYHFALGYRILEGHVNESRTLVADRIEILSVGLIPDDRFVAAPQ